ncbi:MAG: molybdopterin-guanine dinucleotide biosynthesis protein B [Candidatus Cloacimonetes bacterium]|jgi:molybdopterin-guanine dinucleotide biosynthesis protein B|nr:molybdopterin-guanine dinucleotide biosynthesis protein B [Candidatus Cloacimonadota bacterium]MDY0172808.1 molybdopterin-guanine dinucleotide biosynthesis protein B [Candidatus Cloacimonadaceae bacterium]
MKAIAVIGYHHTGKTSMVVALVKALSARGLRVATIKDIHSEKYRADTEGKNTALHIAAGSVQTFARGLYDSAMIYPRPLSLQEILPHIEADFLIVEGMKDSALPKIVCAANTAELDELVDDSTIAIGGLISEDLKHYDGLDIFNAQRNAERICQLVLDKSFRILPMALPECCSRCGSSCYQMAQDIVQGRRSRDECVMDASQSITLEVAGQQVSIVPFVQDILQDTIMAVLGNLKDTDISKEIKIHIRP